MADMTDLDIVPDNDSYDAALHDLAHALVRVWVICEEAGQDSGTGIRSGGNLPEAVSYALGMAAVALRLDRDEDGAVVEDDDYARERAAEALVSHRPGSWEAEHVRALTFPPGLIAHEAA